MPIAELVLNASTVQGFVPTMAPNPRCCSDPQYLCPKCAALALRHAGIAGNSAGSPVEYGELVVNRNDYLPLPEPAVAANVERVLGPGETLPLPDTMAYIVNERRQEQPGIEPVGSGPAPAKSKLQTDVEQEQEEQEEIVKELRRRLGLNTAKADGLFPLPVII